MGGARASNTPSDAAIATSSTSEANNARGDVNMVAGAAASKPSGEILGTNGCQGELEDTRRDTGPGNYQDL